MEMQNVTDLTIPEGNVRTIHDSTSRLIWGRLNYDTKYAGNTLQNGTPAPDAPILVQTVTGEQTVDVTGKNLLGMQNVAEFTQNGVKISVQDGVISLDGTANASTGVVITNLISDLVFEQGKSYTFSAQVLSGSVDSGYNFQIRDANDTNVVSTSPWYYPATYNNLSGVGKAVRLYYGNGRVFTNYKIKIQVEQGSSATTYEPYQSQSYPISLGSIELCKLGNYQDYIYKSGDDWYVHKAIYKYTFTGEEPWQLRNTTADGVSTFSWTFADMPVYAHVDAAVNASKCSYLDNHGRVTNINQMYYNFIGFAFYNKADAPNLSSFYANTNDADLPTFKSGVTGESLYYVLATATDAQITDATLVGQLNAVHEWLTRYGYSSTVTGNLPIIIVQTNL